MKMFKVLVMVMVVLAIGTQSFAVVLEDFADVSEWVVWSGPGAGSPTITTAGGIGSLNYDHTAVQGFDYTQFGLYYPVAADWSAYTGMVLKGITIPADPDIEFSVRIHSGSWAYLMEYQFTFPLVGTGGQAVDIYMPFDLDGTGVAPNNFVDYSEGDFDMSHIDFFSLRTVGDATPNAASGSITIDEIDFLPIPEPATMCLLSLGSLLVFKKRIA